MEKQQINEIEELRAEFHQKELDRIDEVKKERANNIKTIIGNTAKFSDSMLVFMENIGREESKIVKKLFRMQQVAAIGEIVFNTAQAITAALKYHRGRANRRGCIPTTAAIPYGRDGTG